MAFKGFGLEFDQGVEMSVLRDRRGGIRAAVALPEKTSEARATSGPCLCGCADLPEHATRIAPAPEAGACLRRECGSSSQIPLIWYPPRLCPGDPGLPGSRLKRGSSLNVLRQCSTPDPDVFRRITLRRLVPGALGSEARHRHRRDAGNLQRHQGGAEAFLRRQNTTIGLLAVVLAAVIFVLYAFVRAHHSFDPVPTALALAFWTTLSFLLGAACSGFAGYVGMWISIRTNIRTRPRPRTSLNDALQTALRGGAVSGLWSCDDASRRRRRSICMRQPARRAVRAGRRIPFLIVGYGFGASFVALFAQLGGGIYTKAADVGADLVGKVEAGIPEDDPRNPAVIADLVGDNVGDCAGRGADLFESTAAENIGAMILGRARS